MFIDTFYRKIDSGVATQIGLYRFLTTPIIDMIVKTFSKICTLPDIDCLAGFLRIRDILTSRDFVDSSIATIVTLRIEILVIQALLSPVSHIRPRLPNMGCSISVCCG